jgi:hypothetical protein
MVRGYEHAPGRHCGTTAISRLLHFYGHHVSEPMCLGLGAGLFFYYQANDAASPSRLWMGRGPDLETDCLQALGVPVTIRRTHDNAEAWAWVKGEVDGGRPALIGVDLRWLDYYHTKTHFAGHKVLVIGYDEEAQIAVVGDNEFPVPQEVPLASLARARTETIPPFDLANDWYEVQIPATLIPLERAAPEAIVTMARRMLDDRIPFCGLIAMDAAAHDLPTWGALRDWQWCARFGYQVIEKRGTGGGHFRKMYAEFLVQCAGYCPDIVRLNLIEQMRVIADGWTDLAMLLREISERETPSGFDEAGAKLTRLAGLERQYNETALGCRCVLPAG